MSIDKLPLTGIRKYWFFVGLLYVLLSPILLVNFVTFIGAKESLSFMWAVFWIVIDCILFLVLWKCACQKPGTKLLVGYLLLAPLMAIGLLFQLFGVSTEGHEICVLGLCFSGGIYSETFNSYPVSYLRQGPWTFMSLCYAITYIILLSCFYYFSFRLWRANRLKKLEIKQIYENALKADK